MSRDQAAVVLGAWVDLHGVAGTLDCGVLRADDGSSLDLAELADALRDNGDGRQDEDDRFHG